MSTNYYWIVDPPLPEEVVTPLGDVLRVRLMDHLYHIGKRVGRGAGKLGFLWAQDALKVLNYCKAHPDKVCVENEYKETFTGKGFVALVQECEENDYGPMGTQFT